MIRRQERVCRGGVYKEDLDLVEDVEIRYVQKQMIEKYREKRNEVYVALMDLDEFESACERIGLKMQIDDVRYRRGEGGVA